MCFDCTNATTFVLSDYLTSLNQLSWMYLEP